MAIIITVNGNHSGEGFLPAPVGSKTFSVPLALHTNDGSTEHATLGVAPGGAGVAFSSTNVTITPSSHVVHIHATSASHAKDDTVLQVKVGGAVKASFKLTAITGIQLRFQGRFQARFATDGDFYNEPRGTSAGWNFALEGEPDFVPADNVATSITKPVGRNVVFNNPSVPVRSHVAPVGVKVTSILGKAGSNSVEFHAGDPIIGKHVNLGANTYLAANEPANPADPPPAETYAPGLEPMAIFEFHIPGVMSGKPQTAPDRPFATGLFALTPAELSQYAIIPQATFDANRKTALLADYNALPPASRTGTPGGRNLATRIGHLGGDAAAGIAPLQGTLPFGYAGKEQYTGLVNDSLTFVSPESAVTSYFHNFAAWVFFAKLFNYHSDEQCGRVDGHLSVKPSTGNLAADMHEVVRETPTDSGPQLKRDF